MDFGNKRVSFFVGVPGLNLKLDLFSSVHRLASVPGGLKFSPL